MVATRSISAGGDSILAFPTHCFRPESVAKTKLESMAENNIQSSRRWHFLPVTIFEITSTHPP